MSESVITTDDVEPDDPKRIECTYCSEIFDHIDNHDEGDLVTCPECDVEYYLDYHETDPLPDGIEDKLDAEEFEELQRNTQTGYWRMLPTDPEISPKANEIPEGE